MAFIHRGPRNPLLCASKNTPYNVGPGKYDPRIIGERGTQPSLAPFATSEDRGLTEYNYDNYTPGPGEYAQEPQVTPRRDSLGLSLQFASKIPRFGPEPQSILDQATPGPGSHMGQPQWGVKARRKSLRGKKKKKKRAIEFVRVPQAPSIPIRTQAYGYEDGEDGHLHLQASTVKGHSGLGTETVGPGHYPQPSTFTWKRQGAGTGTDFAISGTHREVTIGPQTCPGPGDYLGLLKSEATAKTSPVFASSTQRSDIKGNTPLDVPGPGMYRTEQRAQTALPLQHQHFGSRVARQLYEQQNLPGTFTPGPGQYEIKPTVGVEDEEKVEADPKVPFKSTRQRFDDPATVPPGPGEYHCLPNMGMEMMKKVFSVNDSFGTTAKRFMRLKATQEPRPGPGHYTTQKKKHPQRPASVFVSTVDRFSKNKTTKRGPGHYNPDFAATWAVGVGPAARNSVTRSQSSMFSSTQLRFDDPTTIRKTLMASNLGPGAYTPHQPPNRRGSVSSFRSGNLRFKPPGYTGPGPGEYNLRSSLEKRSYNITIDGK